MAELNASYSCSNDSNIPGSNAPESNAPESNVPGSSKSNVVESDIPESDVPASNQDTCSRILERFDDIFSCTICLMKLDNPHLCPQCSKLYCYDCILEWSRSKLEQSICPNCKCELHLDKLVKVRWFEEAANLQRNYLAPIASNKSTTTSGVEAEDANGNDDAAKEKEICSKHTRDIKLYCCNCNLCICYECTGVDEHKEHTFKSLDLIYNDNLEIAEKGFNQVREHMKKIASLIEKVEQNLQMMKDLKEEKVEEVQLFAENAITGLESQANEKVQKLQAHKSVLEAKMQECDKTLKRMISEVSISSRSQFIAKKSRISRECNKIVLNPIKEFEQIRVPISLKTEFPMMCEAGIFVIENFSSLADMKNVYSNDIEDNIGRTWNISCYKSENQLAVFPKLLKGLSCKAEIILLLLHQEPERIFRRQFTRIFDKPGSYGYKNFMALNTISDGKYLTDDDSLELYYRIRSCDETDGSYD